jgi:hypothetical protein
MNARRPATPVRAAGRARARYRSLGAILVALVMPAAGACSSPPDPGAGGSATSSAEPEAPVATPEATGDTPAGAEEIALSETLDHVHGLLVTGDRRDREPGRFVTRRPHGHDWGPRHRHPRVLGASRRRQ